jgi:hypothetical protein
VERASGWEMDDEMFEVGVAWTHALDVDQRYKLRYLACF